MQFGLQHPDAFVADTPRRVGISIGSEGSPGILEWVTRACVCVYIVQVSYRIVYIYIGSLLGINQIKSNQSINQSHWNCTENGCGMLWDDDAGCV